MHKFGLPFLALTLVAQSAAAAEPVRLDPNQKWVADFGENSCRLIRSFGDKDAPTVLILEQTAPSSSFSWSVAGPALSRIRWSRDVSVQWGPRFEPYDWKFVRAHHPTLGPALLGQSQAGNSPETPRNKVSEKALKALDRPEILGNLEPVLAQLDEEDAHAVDSLRLYQAKRFDITLSFDDFAPAISTLNKCTRGLAAEWGFDESYVDRLTGTPRWANIEEVAKLIVEEYPSKALGKGAQANFRLRVIVGTDGRAERCDWINTTQADDFTRMKKTPCDHVMEHAQFDPALDQEDAPIRSIFETAVVYRTR